MAASNGNTKIEVKEEKANTTVVISGDIDENTDFSAVNWAGANSLTMNLSGVDSINSVGINRWLQWIEGLPGDLNVEVQEASRRMVLLWNLMPTALPVHWVVRSFYVPYFCGETNETHSRLMVMGEDFDATRILRAPELSYRDPETKMLWEIDVIPEMYLEFLNHRKSN